MTQINSKNGISPSSAWLASALLAAPVVLAAAQNAAAQAPPTVLAPSANDNSKSVAVKTEAISKTFFAKRIDQCCVEIVGLDDKGNGVLKGSDGKPFAYSPTGEKTFIKLYSKSTDSVQKVNPSSGDIYLKIKFTNTKNNIEVVGINTTQQTVYKNKAGEIFTLNPATGDMVFIK